MKGEPNAATQDPGGEEPAEKLQRCLSEWLRIIARDKTVFAALEAAEEPDAGDWRRLSLKAGTRFAEAMAVVYPHWQQLFRGWHPFLESEYLELLLTPGENLDSTVERRLLAHYRKTLWDIFFMSEVGSPLAGLTPESWDKFAFWGIQELSDTALTTRASEHLELAAILTSHLAYEARQSFVERDRRDLKRSLDFGSIVRDGDLVALAHCNADAIGRYGAKNVERRFEERISAVLQSLGLFVVATSIGDRRADLVAFAPSGEFTLIVEAKSASRPYALPTKDSRALVEYVGATKETLATLPPVRLVVIVGPDSYTTTLPKKLRQLETTSRVPARYLPAELLVDLRRKLRGPAPLPALLTSLLAADAVVKPRDISHVVHHDERRREAHERLVQELLVTSSSWTRP